MPRAFTIFILLTSIVAPILAHAPVRGGLSVDAWPMFHHDVARSGYSAGFAPHNPALIWKYATGGGIRSSPVVANGSVYVIGGEGLLYAFDQQSGDLRWKVFADSVSPVVYGDSIYVLAGGGLARLNASNGATIWSRSVGGVEEFLLVNGVMYVGTFYALDALDALSGRTSWSINTTGYDHMAYADGRLYLVDINSGLIRAIDAVTHAVAWSYNGTGYGAGGISVADGVVYGVGTPNGGNFTALNATTGRPFWSEQLGGVGPPAVGYGMLFLNWGGGLAAYMLRDGSLIWHSDFGGLVSVMGSAPAVSDGLAFMGDGSDAAVYAVDVMSGKTIWQFSVERGTYSSPAISRGVLYIGDEAGNLYAIGNANQNLLLELGLSFVIIAIALSVSFVALRARRAGRTRAMDSTHFTTLLEGAPSTFIQR